ncbi:MAG: MBOAT family O-acyltransferase [Planctomycetota bacterium]
MLFNSYTFLLAFLPLAFLLFWYGGSSRVWRLSWMTVASYAFYSCWQFDSLADFWQSLTPTTLTELKAALWKWRFTFIMVLTSSIDYWAAAVIYRIAPEFRARRAAILAISLLGNLGLLFLFKYAGFMTQIAADLAKLWGGREIPVLSLILPVGISFYTFESISYVIDVYRGIARPARSYLDYACFISFFPHLVAGPIIRYSDMLHQFHEVAWVRPRPDWNQIVTGLLLLTLGMAKKLLIADTIAVRINPWWDALSGEASLGFVNSWAAVLGYTFRIYFDFSGYSDMAVGLGHLFAVRLPMNFNSPYQALDPSDFWRRWHISLSSWLRDYLYIPLGGNRHGHQYRNLMITMVLGGLWHGAAWLFIVWGAWHGSLLIVYHYLKKYQLLPDNTSGWGRWFNRQLMFVLVVIGWVFFRAADVQAGTGTWDSLLPAWRLLQQMCGLEGFWPGADISRASLNLWALLGICWIICNFAPNTGTIAYDERSHQPLYLIAAGIIMGICLTQMGTPVDFLYFRF